MANLQLVLVAFVGLQHVGFLVLESFLFTQPIGRKIFRTTPETAKLMAVLAANQGLYNGFLAAGLFWSLFPADPGFADQLRIFFLSCVAIAGLVGGLTSSRMILAVQMVPALVALGVVLASNA